MGEPVKLTNNALSGVLRAFYESDEVITLFFCVTHKLKLIKIPWISKIKKYSFFSLSAKCYFGWN